MSARKRKLIVMSMLGGRVDVLSSLVGCGPMGRWASMSIVYSGGLTPGHTLRLVRDARESHFGPAIDAVTEEELSWDYLTPVGQEFRLRDHLRLDADGAAKFEAGLAKFLEENR